MTDPIETAVKSDATTVLGEIKAQLAKLGADEKSIEVKITAEVKSLWGKYELYVVGVGSALVVFAVMRLLHW